MITLIATSAQYDNKDNRALVLDLHITTLTPTLILTLTLNPNLTVTLTCKSRRVPTTDIYMYLPVDSTKPSSYSWVDNVDHFVEVAGGLKTTKPAPAVVTCNTETDACTARRRHCTPISSTTSLLCSVDYDVAYHLFI